MQYELLRSGESTERLVVYFSGWALGVSSVAHLGQPESADLLIVWDHRTAALDFDFSPYSQLYLVAWSMGVWSADRFFAERPDLRSKLIHGTALAGTGYPIEERYGIPEAGYLATLEALHTLPRKRFNRRMVGGKSHRALLAEIEGRTTEELAEELSSPYNYERERPHPVPKPHVRELWSEAWLAGHDLIVPLSSQQAYWSESGIPTRLFPDSMHYLLGGVTRWSELLGE